MSDPRSKVMVMVTVEYKERMLWNVLNSFHSIDAASWLNTKGKTLSISSARDEGKIFFAKEHAAWFVNPAAFGKMMHDGAGSNGDDSAAVKADDYYSLFPVRVSSDYGPSQTFSSTETVLPDEYLRTWQLAFIIRHPALVCPSMYRAHRALKKLYPIGSSTSNGMSRRFLRLSVSLRWTRMLYDWCVSQEGQAPPIILDANDLIHNQSSVVKFCEPTGLNPAALKWVVKEKAPKGVDVASEAEKWKHEFGDEEASFILEIVREVMPDYEFLRQRRTKVTWFPRWIKLELLSGRALGQFSEGVGSDPDDPPPRWVGWGRGHPDYMPEWEMIQVDGGWYHISGASLGADIEFSPDEEFVEERLIPYFLAPSVLSKPIGSNSQACPSLSGLTHYRQLFRKCLGNLYSVPPDYRICLAIEKDVLHAAVRDGLPLNSTLDKLCQIWEKLQMTWYGWKDIDGKTLQEEEEEDPRTLAKPALSAEEFKVNIPPVRVVLNKRAGAPAVVWGAYATHWYRIISFRGLAAILKLKTANGDIDIDQFCNLVFREVEASSLAQPFSAVPIQRFKDLLEVHVRCKGRSEDDNPFEAKMGGSSGFYTSEPPVKGFLDDPQDLAFWYWSILHLAPAHFRSLHREAYWSKGNHGHMIPVALILQALEDAADSWEQVANHLSSLIDNQGAIFDPDEHDRLLFDDNTFSRSHLYFWAIDCLGIFIPSISATIREWRIFWEARKNIFRAGENFIRQVRQEARDAVPPWCWLGECLGNLVPQVEDQVARLEALKSRLEDMRAQIDTLRNGLFNASAVIESRAATELGENVKLLTYISIVYLPLSFCAALWAIDYSYHPGVFTVVTVLLATTTYLVVMNLNNLARLGKEVYQQFRRDIITSMLNDAKWAPTGEAFSQFRPERVNKTPSEWNILVETAYGFSLSFTKESKVGRCVNPVVRKIKMKIMALVLLLSSQIRNLETQTGRTSALDPRAWI
ncbi:hypothetical protein CFD26_105485 [Aspergillus turcosus]|uniref:Uncharacterized protein n=1 Tax=Aspergillus turcosus TaxID=1245748 RepID=A0A3R7IJS7_9EURO|nr:hypothetical protein CFD26_105485 [Aspergillus turcosus]